MTKDTLINKCSNIQRITAVNPNIMKKFSMNESRPHCHRENGRGSLDILVRLCRQTYSRSRRCQTGAKSLKIRHDVRKAGNAHAVFHADILGGKIIIRRYMCFPFKHIWKMLKLCHPTEIYGSAPQWSYSDHISERPTAPQSRARGVGHYTVHHPRVRAPTPEPSGTPCFTPQVIQCTRKMFIHLY